MQKDDEWLSELSGKAVRRLKTKPTQVDTSEENQLCPVVGHRDRKSRAEREGTQSLVSASGKRSLAEPRCDRLTSPLL